jgi:hypothetical protein
MHGVRGTERVITYIVILRRVAVNTVALEKKYYTVHSKCVCCHSSTACKAHAPYFIVICDLISLPYFPILYEKGDDLKKKDTKFVFDFPYKFCLEHLFYEEFSDVLS